MRRPLLLILALVLVFTAANAYADRTATVSRLDEAVAQEFQFPTETRQDCTLGNQNPPSFLVSGWFIGQERYKYLIFPPEQCACPVGFQLLNVNMLLSFDATMVPVSFIVRGDLGEAIWDATNGVWVPGSDYFVSGDYIVTIDEPGVYVITVPMDGVECAFMDYHYFIGLEFVDPFDADLVIDEFPEIGVTYNDWGSGWYDLYFAFLTKSSGKTIIWGDIICCEPAVDNEAQTWGKIKQLYR
ncbi:MAG: hypothetical protein ABIF77_22220 [bacterium]